MISFVPPDGDFELISYRLDVRVKPLFSVDVIIERKSTTKIEYLIKAKSNFKAKSTANNVDVTYIVNFNRSMCLSLMMLNNPHLGLPMEQSLTFQIRKPSAGQLNNSVDKENL